MPVAEPELELVPQVARVEEGRGVQAGLCWYPRTASCECCGARSPARPGPPARRDPRGACFRTFGLTEETENDAKSFGDRTCESVRLNTWLSNVVRWRSRAAKLRTAPNPRLTLSKPVPESVSVLDGKSCRVEFRVPVFEGLLIVDGLHRLPWLPGGKECPAQKGVARCRAPEPEVVFPERAAGLDSVLPSRAAGVEAARRAQKLVRAALGHEVDAHARGRQRRIGTAGRDLDTLERIEVVVDRRYASLADRDAVEVVSVLIRVRTLADEGGLPWAPAPSGIHVVDQNSGHLPNEGPGIPCRGSGLELLLAERRARLDLAGVHRARRCGS